MVISWTKKLLLAVMAVTFLLFASLGWMLNRHSNLYNASMELEAHTMLLVQVYSKVTEHNRWLEKLLALGRSDTNHFAYQELMRQESDLVRLRNQLHRLQKPFLDHPAWRGYVGHIDRRIQISGSIVDRLKRGKAWNARNIYQHEMSVINIDALNDFLQLIRLLQDENSRKFQISGSGNDFTGNAALSAPLTFLFLFVIVAWMFINAIKAIKHHLQFAAERTRKVEKKMRWRSQYDQLTGLINRQAFKRRLREVCENVALSQEEHVLLYLDIDQFRAINDAYGHRAGDVFLKELSAHLEVALRGKGLLARLGGDEFAVLFRNTSDNIAMIVAEYLQKEIKGFTCIWDKQAIKSTATIGISLIKPGKNNPDTVMSEADIACFAGKAAGRDRVQVADIDDDIYFHHIGEMTWAQALPKAMDENRLVLFAQEIQHVENGTEKRIKKHYELLLRMWDENKTLVGPGEFIPVAERLGFITKIDKWVVEAAFRWMRDSSKSDFMLQGGEFAPSFSINVSGQSISEKSFLNDVLGLLKQYQISPRRICFEITETAVIPDLVMAMQFISQLKSLGCRFALDDFGAGAATFTYLQRLDVDFVKIDGQLVKRLRERRLEGEMIEAIVKVARHMRIKTIAEYVEDSVTASKLRQSGVDYIQGYYLHQPQPVDELIDQAKVIAL